MTKRVLVFTAEWCAPCKVLKSKLKGATFDYETINVDEDTVTTKEYHVRGVPTVLVLADDGVTILKSFVGANAQIIGLIEEILGEGN